MWLTRSLICATLTAVLTACAAGPVPERPPKAVRLSIRQLNKGTLYYNKGCFAKAARHFQNAHERFTAADDLHGTANSLNSLANVYYRLNDMESAVSVYEEADALYKQLKDNKGRVRSLTNKAAALAAGGELEAAERALDQADTLAEPDDTLKALRLKARAILKLKSNEPQESKQLLDTAIKNIPYTDTHQYASAQYTMGYVLLSTQQPAKAIAYLNRALNADRAAGDYFGIGKDLESLGDSHAQLSRHVKAVTYYKRSIKIFALLDRIETVQSVSFKLTKSAEAAGINPQTTLKWAAQWLLGQREAGICR